MICFVIAMPCEAIPILQYYGLDRIVKSPFPVYCRGDIALIISGIGKLASAAATAYLYGMLRNNEDHLWLNVGIAGHSHFPIGTFLIARKIRDESSGQEWPILHSIELTLAQGDILTVDHPQSIYTSEWIYEMEASGFYSIARMLTQPQLIYTCKIISDNLESSLHNITANAASRLVHQNLSIIDNLTSTIT